MREIKFRAWDSERGQMYCGDEIEGSDDLMASLSYGELVIFRVTDGGDYDQLIPLQYTGLKDRNGKEIYEGDLIQTKMIRWAYSGEYEGMGNIVGEVKFDDGRVLLHLTNGAMPDLIFGSAHHTVIGNIFENRELLEVVPND